MCDHEEREAAMVVLQRRNEGRISKPAIWCDPCLAPLIKALNDGGLPTVASCCGHGHRPGDVMLADGRTLLVLDGDWDPRLADLIHSQVGCKPGRECQSCTPIRPGVSQ